MLDRWIHHHNRHRPHCGIGGSALVSRLALTRNNLCSHLARSWPQCGIYRGSFGSVCRTRACGANSGMCDSAHTSCPIRRNGEKWQLGWRIQAVWSSSLAMERECASHAAPAGSIGGWQHRMSARSAGPTRPSITVRKCREMTSERICSVALSSTLEQSRDLLRADGQAARATSSAGESYRRIVRHRTVYSLAPPSRRILRYWRRLFA